MSNPNEPTPQPNLWELEAQKRHDRCLADANALLKECQERSANLLLAVSMLQDMLTKAETLESFASVGLKFANERKHEEADSNTVIIKDRLDAQWFNVRKVTIALSEIK